MEAQSTSLLGGETEVLPVFVPDPYYEAKLSRLTLALLSLEESSAEPTQEAMFEINRRCA